MPAPIKLTSDDAGAPELSGEDGKLYDVLKWALPELGWTIAFDDDVNFRIVFRNDAIDGGSGSYLRFVDKSADHALDARFAQVNAYETMSDIDTGTRKTPNVDVTYWCKSSVANATTRRWAIWGDKYRFVIAVWMDTDVNDNRIMVNYAGDLVPFDPADAAFVMRHGLSAAQGNNNNCYSYIVAAGQAGIHFIRSRDGTTGPRQGHLYGFNPTMTTGFAAWAPGEIGTFNDLVTGTPRFTRWVMCDGLQPRGYFPGIYMPQGAWRIGLGSSLAVVPGSVTPDGTHDLLYVSSTNRPDSINSAPMGYLIDETAGWGDV